MTREALRLDEHIIVAIKPAGLLAVPGRGADKQDCLSSRLAAEFGEIHVVHRLDQATSGLMVFARNLVALRNLHAQFREGRVDKAYEAIVSEKLDSTRLSVDLPLMPDWENRPKQKVDLTNGKPSLTHIEVLELDMDKNQTRVRLMPATGRTHQLRVHMMAIGHPIIGDALYGIGSAWLLLHACELAFTHPATGERLAFESRPEF